MNMNVGKTEDSASSCHNRKRTYGDCCSTEHLLEYPLDVSQDPKAALTYLLSLFPGEMFANRLPAIAVKHQLYSIVKDRTLVDRELNLLRDRGIIRFFKLDSGSDEFAVVNDKDFMEIITMNLKARGHEDNLGVSKFVSKVLPTIKDVSIEKVKILGTFSLSDEVITILMNLGILNLRDEKSLWISIPYSSLFMKSLIGGRKAVLSIINKTKYKEIAKNDLEQKDIKLHSKLGIKYHIYDIIGGDMVSEVLTTNGALLRSKQSLKKKNEIQHKKRKLRQ